MPCKDRGRQRIIMTAAFFDIWLRIDRIVSDIVISRQDAGSEQDSCCQIGFERLVCLDSLRYAGRTLIAAATASATSSLHVSHV